LKTKTIDGINDYVLGFSSLNFIQAKMFFLSSTTSYFANTSGNITRNGMACVIVIKNPEKIMPMVKNNFRLESFDFL